MEFDNGEATDLMASLLVLTCGDSSSTYSLEDSEPDALRLEENGMVTTL